MVPLNLRLNVKSYSISYTRVKEPFLNFVKQPIRFVDFMADIVKAAAPQGRRLGS